MSTSDGWYQVAPSYGLGQRPDVGEQSAPVRTRTPSRRSTHSRVLQVPETVVQCGNLSREYPEPEPSGAMVSPESIDSASAGFGMLGGVAPTGAARAPVAPRVRLMQSA